MDVNTHLECLELRIFGILTRFLSVEGGAPRHPSRGSYSAHRHLQVSHYTFIQVASAEGLSIFGLITFAVTSNSLLWDSFVSIAKDQIVAALTSLRPTLTQFIWQKKSSFGHFYCEKYCKGQSDTWNCRCASDVLFIITRKSILFVGPE